MVLDRLPNWALVLLFAVTLTAAVLVNVDPFGETLGVPNLLLEALLLLLLYLEYREMRERGWF